TLGDRVVVELERIVRLAHLDEQATLRVDELDGVLRIGRRELLQVLETLVAAPELAQQVRDANLRGHRVITCTNAAGESNGARLPALLVGRPREEIEGIERLRAGREQRGEVLFGGLELALPQLEQAGRAQRARIAGHLGEHALELRTGFVIASDGDE